jgi:hypothetical protein
MKKVGQHHTTSVWGKRHFFWIVYMMIGGRINDLASDQEKVVKALNEYQLNLWDNMIWPMLSTAEADGKEITVNSFYTEIILNYLDFGKECKDRLECNQEGEKEQEKERNRIY